MSCPICSENYNRDRQPMVLPCGHGMCSICENYILEKKCPFDRQVYDRVNKNFELIRQLEIKEKEDREKPTGIFKVILLGSVSVGKTAFKYYVQHQNFNKDLLATIFQEFACVYFQSQGETYGCHIWDTAGSQRFRSIGKSYYVKANVVILVYNVNDPKTFEDLRTIMEDVNEMTPDSSIYLIGNKNDLKMEVKQQKIDAFASQINAVSFLISCAQGTNVKEAWNSITNCLVASYNPPIQPDPQKGTPLSSKETKKPQKKKGWCC